MSRREEREEVERRPSSSSSSSVARAKKKPWRSFLAQNVPEKSSVVQLKTIQPKISHISTQSDGGRAPDRAAASPAGAGGNERRHGGRTGREELEPESFQTPKLLLSQFAPPHPPLVRAPRGSRCARRERRTGHGSSIARSCKGKKKRNAEKNGKRRSKRKQAPFFLVLIAKKKQGETSTRGKKQKNEKKKTYLSREAAGPPQQFVAP